MHVCMHTCMCLHTLVLMYVCIYVYVCVYIYKYGVYTHTHTHTGIKGVQKVERVAAGHPLPRHALQAEKKSNEILYIYIYIYIYIL